MLVSEKQSVKAYWEVEPCGTRVSAEKDRRRFFAEVEADRYRLEPYIHGFARFPEARGKRVLEIGVGAGTDFVNWVRNGALATGLDLTAAGVKLTRERLALEHLGAPVMVGDAENLPFPDGHFDLVYSYGVLHHSPDTQRAVSEVRRVLRPGGQARVMVYHHPSWTAWMLWAVHCAAKGTPWRSPRWAIHHHLESPGTKAYSLEEARSLFSAFSRVSLSTRLGTGDLLAMLPSRKYQKPIHRLLWSMYPRRLIQRFGQRLGLGLFIEAVK